MDIKYLGHASFLLKGKQGAVVTDPFSPDSVGLKFPKNIEADVVTVSHAHDDHNNVSDLGGAPFIVNGPGEYEIKGIAVVGLPSFHDASRGSERGANVIYRIEMDGVTFVHLGDLGHELSVREVELLDGVDVLFVPVGGHFTIDAAAAKRITSEIDPSIVIPMHYRRPGMNEQIFGALSDVSAFLREMNKDGIVPQPKLSVTRDRLPEELQVVVLE